MAGGVELREEIAPASAFRMPRWSGKDGLMRRHGFVDGYWHDQWLGEILRDEWEAREENKR